MKFIIDGIYYKKKRTLPGLNDYTQISTNPHMRAKLKANCELIIINKIRRDLGQYKAKKPIRIIYRYYEMDKQRDLDNIAGVAHKFIQDALVKCGVLQGDGWKYIVGFEDEFYVDKDNPRIEVELKEMG